MNSSKWLEKFLQAWRFKKVISYISGNILDYGGNDGELGEYLKQYSYPAMMGYQYVNHLSITGKYNTITCLAVIEHMTRNDALGVINKFKKHLTDSGSIIITTPSILSKPILEFLAWVGLLDRENIREHKCYYSTFDLQLLAAETGMDIVEYKRFQFGFNQFAVMKKAIPINDSGFVNSYGRRSLWNGVKNEKATCTV